MCCRSGRAAARNAAQALRGVLSVGLSVAAAGELPTRLLAAFEQAWPEVRVELRTFDLASPAAGLLDHSTDVAFVRLPIEGGRPGAVAATPAAARSRPGGA